MGGSTLEIGGGMPGRVDRKEPAKEKRTSAGMSTSLSMSPWAGGIETGKSRGDMI